MKEFSLVLLLLATVFTGFSQEVNSVLVVEPGVFLEEIQKPEIQLIDVRTPQEFQEAHLEAARNIDFLGEDFLAGFSELDKDKPVYIYCRSGKRSGKAAQELAAAGFRTIVDLNGGYLGIEEYRKEKLQKQKN